MITTEASPQVRALRWQSKGWRAGGRTVTLIWIRWWSSRWYGWWTVIGAGMVDIFPATLLKTCWHIFLSNKKDVTPDHPPPPPPLPSHPSSMVVGARLEWIFPPALPRTHWHLFSRSPSECAHGGRSDTHLVQTTTSPHFLAASRTPNWGRQPGSQRSVRGHRIPAIKEVPVGSTPRVPGSQARRVTDLELSPNGF